MTKLLFTLIVAAGLAVAQQDKTPARMGREANVELTIYLVTGAAQSQAAVKDEVPADLEATLRQLRGVFAYKSYKLIEAITMRGRNLSGSEVEGALPNYMHYDFKYAYVTISPETPHTIRIDGLRLQITQRARQETEVVALVSTNIDVKEGQKTVVGKSAVNGSDALFLVIVPKVIE